MTLTSRPFAGSWRPNARQTVQVAPDALVYLNGATSLPGCRTCNHEIDVNQFVTSISTDCGVAAGASTASLTLSVPKAYGDGFWKDGNSLLRPGLEIHIYFKGYFPVVGMAGASAPLVAGVDPNKVPQFPYYPAFHGVVTTVDDAYGSGFYQFTVTCAGMLHFWEHMKFSRSGSFFGARPQNSATNTTLTGHPFSGRTPYSIIYNLYRDTNGSAAGVGYALSSRTNFGAVSSNTRERLYSMTTRYWERRFRNRPYGLRMHGASGTLFTASQQAYLSLFGSSTEAGRNLLAGVNSRTARNSRDSYAEDPAVLLGMRAVGEGGRILRQVDVSLLPAQSGEAGASRLDATQMQAFVTDIGTYGDVNFFESTYESKLDVATQVTNVTGYEFYQDVDGDLVFKPPMYNLDTSSSRVYRIEPIDIISLNHSHKEPEATYCIVRNGAFRNLQGAVDDAEWGARSVYVDYRLVAQFGWREASLETSYYGGNAQAAFFGAVAHLDKINRGMFSGSLTIPLRPEIRPGYPVYIVDEDSYYYVDNVSHSFSYGSQCTTTLSLVARRTKFLPPGPATVTTQTGNLPSVDLGSRTGTAVTLQEVDNSGVPRMVGFPNVVMALDPNAINPQFAIQGFAAEEANLTTGNEATRNRNRDRFVSNLIQALWERGVLSEPGADRGAERTGSWYSSGPNQAWVVAVANQFTTFTISAADLRASLETFLSLRRASRTLLESLRIQLDTLSEQQTNNDETAAAVQAQIEEVRRRITTINSAFSPARPGDAPVTDPLSTAASSLNSVVDILRGASPNSVRGLTPSDLTRTDAQLSNSDRVALLTYLFSTLQTSMSGAARSDLQQDPSGTFNETANLLEALDDRKASMGVTTPGQYRYFSSAHPDPNQQGNTPLTGEQPVPPPETPSGGDDPPSPITPTLSGVQQYQNTRMTPVQGIGYLRNAWAQIYGSPPSREVLSCLYAQWALETGAGYRMFNWNFGGVKANPIRYQGGRVFLNTTEGEQRTPTQRWFRAYSSAEEGASDYLGVLLRNHGEAVRQVVASNNPALYVPGIRRSGYFTGPEADYARNVSRLSRRALDHWIPLWENENGPIDSNAGRPSSGSTIRDERNLRTVAILPATSLPPGVPERRAPYFVRRTSHVPERGLRIKTFRGGTTAVAEPTFEVRTLTFEENVVEYAVSRAVPVLTAGATPADLVAVLQAALSVSADTPLSDQLAANWVSKVGALLTDTAATAPDLMDAAVEGISGLRGPRGPIDSENISGGTPNNRSSLTGPYGERGGALLREKARLLVGEVSVAWRAEIQRAINALRRIRTPSPPAAPAGGGTPPAPAPTTVPADVERSLTGWRAALSVLYQNRTLPATVPAPASQGVETRRSRVSTFSPVFPVSDDRGYCHYGTYQYGRGLSIEPGGNYQRLLSQDPLTYANPRAATAFARSLYRNRGRGPLLENPEVQASLRALAEDRDFANGPGGEAALRWAEGRAAPGSPQDRVEMIYNGLRNSVQSSRDAVMQLPINNAAFALADLRPAGTNETCECRGAEADLLLAAYMAGAEQMVSVESPDDAVNWLRAQAEDARGPWELRREELRGRRT